MVGALIISLIALIVLIALPYLFKSVRVKEVWHVPEGYILCPDCGSILLRTSEEELTGFYCPQEYSSLVVECSDCGRFSNTWSLVLDSLVYGVMNKR